LGNLEKLEYVAKQVGYRSLSQYRFRTDFLFQGLSLKGLRVLDVGCGQGSIALWAALHGASFVLGLEPEADGSTTSTLNQFRGLIRELKLEDKVVASPAFLQDVEPSIPPFEVAVLYNVINHISETATMRLHQDDTAADEFIPALTHLRQLLAPGAYVIVADCGRYNFWPRIGLKGPLTPTIEWDKHQQPETWTSIFQRAGFEFYDQRWSPISPFYFLGGKTSNRWLQYFAASHFILRLRAK